eukprot:752522-Hanusia_phi.AAC.2
MMHYASLQDGYDVGVLMTGDKDFMPAMSRVKQVPQPFFFILIIIIFFFVFVMLCAYGENGAHRKGREWF